MKALALLLIAVSAQAGTITFPAHIGYHAERWAPTYGNRIRVCPLPTTVEQCAAGIGWQDPDEVSPIPGYWLRHIIARKDGAAILFFCKNGTKCQGDD